MRFDEQHLKNQFKKGCRIQNLHIISVWIYIPHLGSTSLGIGNSDFHLWNVSCSICIFHLIRVSRHVTTVRRYFSSCLLNMMISLICRYAKLWIFSLSNWTEIWICFEEEMLMASHTQWLLILLLSAISLSSHTLKRTGFSGQYCEHLFSISLPSTHSYIAIVPPSRGALVPRGTISFKVSTYSSSGILVYYADLTKTGKNELPEQYLLADLDDGHVRVMFALTKDLKVERRSLLMVSSSRW